MKYVLIIVVCAAAASLLACGGGGTDTIQSVQVNPQQAKNLPLGTVQFTAMGTFQSNQAGGHTSSNTVSGTATLTCIPVA